MLNACLLCPLEILYPKIKTPPLFAAFGQRAYQAASSEANVVIWTWQPSATLAMQSKFHGKIAL